MSARALLAVALMVGLADRRLWAGEWQLTSALALAPGKLGDWDDFQVAAPSLVRSGHGWSLYYTGGRLDEYGLSTAIGLATSPDGATWVKRAGPDPRGRTGARRLAQSAAPGAGHGLRPAGG